MRVVPALLLGVGLGGFFDGIVLHQLLQWHHLVSTQVPVVDVPTLEANTFADGLFHQAMWLVTIVGVAALCRQLAAVDRLPARALVGGALIGWGAFNVVDEAVFHVALNLHHIRPGPDVVMWDLVFAGWGVAMVAAGLSVLALRRRSA